MLLLWFWVSSCVGQNPPCTGPDDSIQPSQYYGLKLFYESTGGPYWNMSSCDSDNYAQPWNFDSPSNPCYWTGVSCNDACMVDQMFLDCNKQGANLTGTLPDDVFINFTDISLINLEFNHIRSKISSPNATLLSMPSPPHPYFEYFLFKPGGRSLLHWEL